MSSLDYLVIFLYCATVLYGGLRTKNRVTTLRDYAIGGRDFPTGTIISNIFATSFGASALNGTIILGYYYGFRTFVFFEFLETLGVFLTFFIAAKYIHRFYGMISVGDLMEHAYGKWAKVVTGIIAILTCYLSLTAQIVGMGLIFEYFFGFSFNTSIIMSSCITILYTVAGGIKGVMWTGVIQLSLIAISLPLLFSLLIDKIGGYSAFFSAIPDIHLNMSIADKENQKWLYFGIVDAIPAIYPSILQRMLMTSSQSQTRDVLTKIVPMQFFSTLLIITMGIAFYVFRQKFGVDIEPRQLLNYFIDQYIPMVFKGFVVAGIIAVLMSTIDSFLNTTGIILVNDVIKPFYPALTDERSLKAVRLLTLLIGITSVFLAFFQNSIVFLRIICTNLWSSTVSIPLLLCIMGVKSSPYSFFISAICGTTTSILIRMFCADGNMVSLLPSVIASALSFYAVHSLWGKKSLTNGDDEDSEGLSRKFLHDLIMIADKNKKRTKLHMLINEIKSFGIVKYLRYDILESGAEDLLLPGFIILTSVFPLFMCDGSLSKNPILLAMKYSAAIFAFIVIFRHKMPAWYQKRWELFWHIFVLFSLPFSGMVLLIIGEGALYWHISMLLVIFLTSISVSREMFLIEMFLGGFLAYLLVCDYAGYQFILAEPGLDKYALVYGYCFSIIIALIFSERRQLREAERTSAYIKASSIICHEMSSPLGVFSCSLERINKVIRGLDLSEAERKECESAINSSKVTVSNIDNFMMLFLQNIKNAEDFAIFELSMVNLKSVIDNIMLHYPLHERKNEIIKIDYSNKFEVFGNELLLSQSLLNVLKNSLFFISGIKGANITISFEQPKNSAYNLLKIKDTGIGISDSVRSKIFKKFYTQRDGGSGLGLFFCYNAMQRMGGVVECDSKVGEFTEMIFKFPKIETLDISDRKNK